MENSVERLNQTKLDIFFTIDGFEKKFPALRVGTTLSYKTAIKNNENYVVVKIIEETKGLNIGKITQAKICPILTFNKKQIEYIPIAKDISLDLKTGWNFKNCKFQYGKFEYDIIKKILPKYEYLDIVSTEYQVLDNCIITKIPKFQVGNVFVFVFNQSKKEKMYVVTEITQECVSVSRTDLNDAKDCVIYNSYKKNIMPNNVEFKDITIDGEYGTFINLILGEKMRSGCGVM